MNKSGRNRTRNSFNLRQRLKWVGLALGLCSVSLVGRAAYVQIINSDFYQRQGEARYLRELPINTSRGMITDRNGEPVAVSTRSPRSGSTRRNCCARPTAFRSWPPRWACRWMS